MRYTILTESPNFMNLGLLYVHTSDELGSVFIPTTRIERPEDGSNCILPDHCIGVVTADRVIETISEQTIIPKVILKLGEEKW